MSKEQVTNGLLEAIRIARTNQIEQMKVQDALSGSNKVSFERNEDISGEGLLKEVQVLLDDQITNAESIKGVIGNIDRKLLPYEIRFNKNLDILQQVQSLIKSSDDEDAIVKIAEGKAPFGYDNTIPAGTLPNMGAGEFWGSAKNTVYSASLAVVNKCLGDLQSQQDGQLKLSAIYDVSNVNSNSVFFQYPVNDSDACSKLQDLVQESIFHSYHDDGTIKFGTIHGSYAFGGARNYSTDTKPYDCSSLIERAYGLDKLQSQPTATTADLYFTHLVHIYKNLQRVLPENIAKWQESPSGVLPEHFSTVNNHESVKPGGILVQRKFASKEDILTSFGSKGGHVSIILGQNLLNESYTALEVNRADYVKGGELLPAGSIIEGFGIREVSARTGKEAGDGNPWVQSVVLKYTGSNQFQQYEGLELSNINDLGAAVSYFDNQLGLAGDTADDLADIVQELGL